MEPSQEELEELTRIAQKAISECKPRQEAHLLVPTDIWTWLVDTGRLKVERFEPMREVLKKGYIIEDIT